MGTQGIGPGKRFKRPHFALSYVNRGFLNLFILDNDKYNLNLLLIKNN